MLTLHTVGMAILVGASFVVHLRVMQVAGAIPLRRLLPLYRFIWIGFAINLLSGLVLFVTEAADRVVDPVFYVKMASIAVVLQTSIRFPQWSRQRHLRRSAEAEGCDQHIQNGHDDSDRRRLRRGVFRGYSGGVGYCDGVQRR